MTQPSTHKIAQEIADHNSVLLTAPVANILVGCMHSLQGVANDIVYLLKNPKPEINKAPN